MGPQNGPVIDKSFVEGLRLHGVHIAKWTDIVQGFAHSCSDEAVNRALAEDGELCAGVTPPERRPGSRLLKCGPACPRSCSAEVFVSGTD